MALLLVERSKFLVLANQQEKKVNATDDIRVVKWLFKFAKPFKTFMILSLVFMIITAGLELIVPYLTKIAVDQYIFPSWREAKYLDNSSKTIFKERFKGRYPNSILEIDKDTFLIDTSSVSTEDKHDLEKYGLLSREQFLVIDLSKLNFERVSKINELAEKNPDVLRPLEGYYYAGYSSLSKLDEQELTTLRGDDISKVIRVSLFLLFSIFCIFVSSSLYTYLLHYSGQKIMLYLRESIFSHILSLPQSFFDKNPIGRLTTRVTNDANAINEMYTSVLVQFFKDVIEIIGVLIVMFYINRSLTLYILLITFILGIVGALFRMRLKTVYRNVRKTIAQLNSFVQESVRGIVIIKLYRREKSNFERFKDVNRGNFNANMDQLFAFATFRPIIEFVSVFAIALILWYGGLSVMSLDLTIGALIAYLYYVRMLFRPILELAERYNIFQSAIAASENLYDLSKIDPEHNGTGRKVDTFNGKLEFKNVWFSYNDREWVLKDVSFKINPGETVALVGLTGSGKSTIVNLILRFYEIQKGEILFDDVDIREYSPESLRENMSAVFQDLFFHGNIIEDGDFIDNSELPNGFGFDDFSSIDENFISSGEKQIISLSTAFKKDVNLLILDEATSHVDAKMESEIRGAIYKGSKRRTTLIIAHRLSNVKDADRIIVINKGEIYEVGTHSELLEKKGIYHNLYHFQSEVNRISAHAD